MLNASSCFRRLVSFLHSTLSFIISPVIPIMADSQQFKTAERHLTQALESDQRLVSSTSSPSVHPLLNPQVTFRDVARELGCHVHLAKK